MCAIIKMVLIVVIFLFVTSNFESNQPRRVDICGVETKLALDFIVSLSIESVDTPASDQTHWPILFFTVDSPNKTSSSLSVNPFSSALNCNLMISTPLSNSGFSKRLSQSWDESPRMRCGSLFQDGSERDKNSWTSNATLLSSAALGTIKSCCPTSGTRTGTTVSSHFLHSFLTRSHGRRDTDWKALSFFIESDISCGIMVLSMNGFTIWMIVHGLMSVYVFPPETAILRGEKVKWKLQAKINCVCMFYFVSKKDDLISKVLDICWKWSFSGFGRLTHLYSQGWICQLCALLRENLWVEFPGSLDSVKIPHITRTRTIWGQMFYRKDSSSNFPIFGLESSIRFPIVFRQVALISKS